MNNSQKFTNQIKEDKILCIVFTIISISFISFLIIKSLSSICSTTSIIIICSIIDILIFIIGYNYFKTVDKEINKDKIYYELDNKIEKVFEQYNLYITENYIISIKPFKTFSILTKDIQAIDTHKNSKYYYKYYYAKKGEKVVQKIT